jgi:hypothetical protein
MYKPGYCENFLAIAIGSATRSGEINAKAEVGKNTPKDEVLEKEVR